ncbi:Galactoside 2-alpha-L-fucosyltransferase [Linum grandiflorum]
MLSMSNKLVTSSKSTFRNDATSLGTLRPWIVMNPDPKHGGRTPELSCERGWILEPCFHFPPWFAYPDQPKNDVGNVGRCEEVSWGLKLLMCTMERKVRDEDKNWIPWNSRNIWKSRR